MVLEIHGLWTIIGIVSAALAKIDDEGVKTCDLDNYIVYTDVSKLYDWVYQVILETF